MRPIFTFRSDNRAFWWPVVQVTPRPRNAQAVLAIAKWLHPAAFGLPADRS